MLREVLQAIENADGPVHVGELGRQLQIERSALEGMIDYWVRKGRLQGSADADTICAPMAGHCGGGCTIGRHPHERRLWVNQFERQ